MNTYAELAKAIAKAIEAAKEAGLDAETIAGLLTKAAELVESEG